MLIPDPFEPTYKQISGQPVCDINCLTYSDSRVEGFPEWWFSMVLFTQLSWHFKLMSDSSQLLKFPVMQGILWILTMHHSIMITIWTMSRLSKPHQTLFFPRTFIISNMDWMSRCQRNWLCKPKIINLDPLEICHGECIYKNYEHFDFSLSGNI